MPIFLLNTVLKYATSEKPHLAAISFCENKIPVLKANYDCGGKGPRDFKIFENLLVCTNEDSDNVTFFEVQNGELKKLPLEINLKTPLCVI